jgi:general secretion pathway protein G
MNDPSPRQRLRRRPAPHRRGFSLIELMVVIAIIGLIAALIAPQLIGALDDSQAKTTEAQISQLESALTAFRLDVGRYPTNEEGLDALVEQPAGVSTWSGPYLNRRELPLDAWQQPFRYERPATRGGIEYDLYSLGADGAEGGDGNDADIGNW